MTKHLIKLMLIFLGIISLALGFIGMFVPILPTTPFLLLSSYCFARSSSRLYDWLISHRIFGDYIYDYLTYRAVKKSAKVGSLLLLWASLLCSAVLVKILYVRLGLFAIGCFVSIHIMLLKTMPSYQHERRKGPIKDPL